MEIRPGLAPDKRWVAAIRLDGFGMRIIGLPDGCCPRALSLTCSGAAVTPRATSDWSLPPDVRRTLRGTNSARRCLRLAGAMVFPPRVALGTRPSQDRVISPSPRERKENRRAGGSWNSFRSWTVRSTNRRGTAKIGGSRRSRTVPSCASDRRSPARASEPSFRVDLHHDFPLIRRACFIAPRKGKLAEREGLAPPIPQCGTTVFGTASSSGRTRSVTVAPEAGLAPATLRLTGGRTTIVLLRIQTGLPGRTRTCDLRVRSSAFCNLNYGE